MVVDRHGSLGHSPEDLTSFTVQAEAEDPECIALALRRTREHARADRPPHRYKNHRIIECFELEGIFRGHLAQTPLQ